MKSYPAVIIAAAAAAITFASLCLLNWWLEERKLRISIWYTPIDSKEDCYLWSYRVVKTKFNGDTCRWCGTGFDTRLEAKQAARRCLKKI